MDSIEASLEPEIEEHKLQFRKLNGEDLELTHKI